MTIEPHAQKILEWRESMALLPDAHFFEIMRIYLGKIQTPFNKQKLIETLGSFLRKTENKQTIIKLLSLSDLQIICAVKFLSKATHKKLAAFFKDTFSYAALYDRLLNLEERLIIYRHLDKNSQKTIIDVNPMLDDVFEPYLKKSILLESPELSETFDESQFLITNELLAAYISFVNSNSDLLKADGTFKKRVVQELEELFPEKTGILQTLTTAFINLSIFKDSLHGYTVDKSRIEAFAHLEPTIRLAYLCVAFHGRFSRTALVRQAKMLIETATSIPPQGYTRKTLLRAAYLISDNQNDVPGVSSFGARGRFATILKNASRTEQVSKPDPEEAGSSAGTISQADEENLNLILDRLIDTAEQLGIISKKGKTENGENIFVTGSAFLSAQDFSSDDAKVLSLDADFSVTLLPGLSFSSLLPLMSFMEITRFDTAATFEITKKSIMQGFDFGLSAEKIIGYLEKHCPYEIPQNLKITIDEWSHTYSSASIYKGYILKVSGENSSRTEKNPIIAPFISETLAPGIFLLSVSTDEEANELISKSGLDFIGKIKSTKKEHETLGFPEFFIEKHNFESASDVCAPSDLEKLSTDEERAVHFDEMRKALEKIELTKDQLESLDLRIKHKLILTAEQLRADSVKFEIAEAYGMDFAGKVHVIEGAITSRSMVELEYDDKYSSDGIIYMGTPLGIERLDGDAAVKVLLQPNEEEKTFSIGQARRVKRIRGRIF
ncbi:helicase-associated domain-containing protein [Treponema zioleckii]|uniref:helicase-associated domain-containing protein n=1 Tax=Treponema zioleckii TaxID=331680 RepID=UPI00168B8D1E|nr:helicase-associated domain-containing protein [Treponema zioleckii]